MFLHNSAVHLFGCSSYISCYLKHDFDDMYVIKKFSLGHIPHQKNLLIFDLKLALNWAHSRCKPEPVTLTSKVKRTKQRGQHDRP